MFLYSKRIKKLELDNWVLCSGSWRECGRCRKLYRCDAADNGGNRRVARGSTKDVPCWITHRPQCRTGLRTSVHPEVVPKASGTVHYFVDALTFRHLGEAMPCAGGVRDASDDSRMVNVLQSLSIQSMAAQHLEGVMRLYTGRHESLDVLCYREIVSNNYAQHQTAAAHDSRQWWRLVDMQSPPLTIGKKNFADLSQLRLRLFRLAHFWILYSSILREDSLEAGIIK